MTKPLSGIRVIELGQVIAAPVAGTLLADFGAEVIKVEPPVLGDKMRKIGHNVNGVGLDWCVIARNKKSVTLNLHHLRGQEILKKLVAKGDVLLENLRPGLLEKLGLGEEVLLGVNPDIVFGRVSGFGKTGPLKNKTSYDTIALGYGGLTYVTGYQDRPPVRAGTPIADYLAAVFTAFGIVTALYQRDMHHTRGQVVDVALYEAVWRVMGNLITPMTSWALYESGKAIAVWAARSVAYSEQQISAISPRRF